MGKLITSRVFPPEGWTISDLIFELYRQLKDQDAPTCFGQEQGTSPSYCNPCAFKDDCADFRARILKRDTH